VYDVKKNVKETGQEVVEYYVAVRKWGDFQVLMKLEQMSVLWLLRKILSFFLF
jgi:hypothetical protein